MMNYDQENDKPQENLLDSKIIYKTRGNTGIQGKQRVFVSYDVKDKYLQQTVCDDILSVIDCAILFSEETDIRLENVAETVGRIDLFVLCVTYNYLHGMEVNHEEEIRYAKTHGIPVLPILLDKNIDAEYQESFPNIQYLEKFNDDPTAIPYRKKLSDYLSSVLINDELFEKIQDAFDAFIFLSYRKKDRKYAQELMHIIHSNQFCRSVAVWYDEFLVPGENFSDALKKMIEDSHLFTMVVTPNILEDGNYIMREEYPFALDAGKRILPVSMIETDEKQLQSCFTGLSSPVDGRKKELSERLKHILSEFAVKPRDGEPRHTFFIGLAYMFGIYMEEDKQMGLSMISSAAEENLPEAAKKLGQIYRYGQGVQKDISAAIDWQKKYRDLLKSQYTDVYDDSIHVLIEAEYDLTEMELEDNRIKDARNTCWRGLYLCRDYGRFSYYSPSRIPYYAKLYLLLGDVFFQRSDEKQALECYSKDLPIYLELADKNPDNWEILMNTCRCFFKLIDLKHSFSDWYYKKILGYLNQILSVHFDADVYLMLARFYIMFGGSLTHDVKDSYEKTISICTELCEKHKTVDTFAVLVDGYLSLSKYFFSNNQRNEAESYIQKAEAVCRENIRMFESAAGYFDLLKCYFQKVEILRSSEENPDSLSPESSAKLSRLYDEVQQVMSILEKEYPGPTTDFLTFRNAAVFYELCTTQSAMEAYGKALALARKQPILYYNDYYLIKKTLWEHEKLDQKVYQNYIAFYIIKDIEQNRCFEVFNSSEKISFFVTIMGEQPASPVLRIMISEDVLLENRAGYSGNPNLRNGVIQICKADSEFRQYGRDNPMPDEFVYLQTETSSGKIEEVEYIRCYG